jgi:hypothetical protein
MPPETKFAQRNISEATSHRLHDHVEIHHHSAEATSEITIYRGERGVVCRASGFVQRQPFSGAARTENSTILRCSGSAPRPLQRPGWAARRAALSREHSFETKTLDSQDNVQQ